MLCYDTACLRATYQPICHLVFKEPTGYARGKGIIITNKTYTKTIIADVRLYIPNVDLVDVIKMTSNSKNRKM